MLVRSTPSSPPPPPPPQGRTGFTLVTQLADTVVSLLVISALVYGPMREAPAPSSPPSPPPSSDLFIYSLRRPLEKGRGWAVWAGIGLLLSPLVVGSTALLLSSVGYEESVGGRGTVDGVASMIDLDLNTYLSLLSVTGFLAPVLEETVFRGFLLTRYTKPQNLATCPSPVLPY